MILQFDSFHNFCANVTQIPTHRYQPQTKIKTKTKNVIPSNINTQIDGPCKTTVVIIKLKLRTQKKVSNSTRKKETN